MRIIYAGSPEYAVPALDGIVQSGRSVVAVITQPDKPTGRKRVLTPTPVKAYALSHGIPVLDLPKIRTHVAEVAAFRADLMITCAYGQILSKELLDLFPQGVWNLHASLLPKLRGASPIQSAILEGFEDTGVTVMKTEEGLDTGDILLVKRIRIGNETCGELSQKLSILSAEAAIEALGYIDNGDTQLLLQNDLKATYCKKVSKEDARLDFHMTAVEIVRRIKAYSPDPCAYCTLNGSNLNILNAELCGADVAVEAAEAGSYRPGEVVRAGKKGITVACGEGCISLTALQLAGGKTMKAADFVNGRKIKAGDILE
ncbi:MAG: methionyl-tRNA formyltransferase [Clostridia bacterium]|nr:methionyl-tRNA formyltransferase [Clostridia bacterium]